MYTYMYIIHVCTPSLTHLHTQITQNPPPNQVLVNVARSLGTKTIHYTLLDPLLNMYLSTRAMDRLTKARK